MKIRLLILPLVGVIALLVSCVGPVAHRPDASTLTGRVMCGYQGWFNAEGDGAGRGYNHWTKGGGRPTARNIRVDLWPDLSEFPAAERFPTDLFHADGRRAEVFSSHRRETVLRHFQWMEEHGIDGVFVQRFIQSLARPANLAHNNAVLVHCREGARRHGRTYALMYDLSGLAPGHADRLIADWTTLLRDTQLTRDPAYQRHRGKPVLALWGCGFRDDKARPSLEDWRKIVTFLKTDPAAGGVTIMLGVPSFWRELRRDAVADPALHEILRQADIVSPWTPGRYRTPAEAARHGAEVWQPDLAWCRERGLDYLPVAFPGFSWHNMQPNAPLDAIPRLQGRFFWSQVTAAKRAGAGMLYVAMFDEVDEGTAIFKCTNTPPASDGAKFITYEGLPSDHYLFLTGAAGRVLRGALAPTDVPPVRAAGIAGR
jgi:hypothetical protein